MNKPPEKTTLMVVDDTPANLRLLQETLQFKGYRILAFSRGAAALSAALKNPPDLILLDIEMPEMNGFEVCERLKADPVLKDIPVIFISALSETEDKVRAFAVGGVDYITKPFQFEEVHARIETHLRILSLQRQLGAHNEDLERMVAERTRELASAYERLRELDRLKDDFLSMISHEIRTPANGVLGVGELLVELCADSEDGKEYGDLFHEASARLRHLIEDASLIGRLAQQPLKSGLPIAFYELLDAVKTALPDIRIAVDPAIGLEPIGLQGDHRLLKKALETLIQLAAAFSQNKLAAFLRIQDEGENLRIHLDLDDLLLSNEQAASFFEIGSAVRSSSSAEALGLAPVVAHKILSALGGEMRLVKEEGDTGHLEALFLKGSHTVQAG
ncbi:MAG: response regulator, partial [Pseudomonadota bacterium]